MCAYRLTEDRRPLKALGLGCLCRLSLLGRGNGLSLCNGAVARGGGTLQSVDDSGSLGCSVAPEGYFTITDHQSG